MGNEAGFAERLAGTRSERIIVRCAANPREHGLDVGWMKGAIFEFDSADRAEQWLSRENRKVPGTLFVTRPSRDTGPLPVDFYVKYRSP